LFVHVIANEFTIELYCVSGTVEYLQNEFSSVSTVRLIFVVPETCTQVGCQFDSIGALVSEGISTIPQLDK